jgi:type I restriction enzyme S subunit
MMKHYDSYKDSGIEWIGEIPSHWECIRLGMLGRFSSSGIDKKIEENEPTVRMVNYTDIIKSRVHRPIINNDVEFMVVSSPRSKIEEHTLNIGDLVFIPSSETDEDLGLSSLIEVEDVVFSYHIIRFQFSRELNHQFKKYLTNYHNVLKQFSSEGKGTTRQIIGRNVFRNVYVTVPPISEQEHIVSYLDDKTTKIDELIQTKLRKIDLLKEYRNSLINTVVTKGLNPNVPMKDSGIEWIGEIPSHWEVKRLKHLSQIEYGISPPDTTYNDEGIGSVLINGPVEYSVSDFGYTRSIKWTTEPKKFTKKGSLLFCLRGSTTGRLNITHDDVSIGRGVCSIFSNHNQWYLIYSMFCVRYWLSGQLSGSTFPSVTKDDVDNYHICNPPISEQEHIVSYLDEKTSQIDKTIDIEKKKIELLKEYRQSLISNVVTGKIKVIE